MPRARRSGTSVVRLPLRRDNNPLAAVRALIDFAAGTGKAVAAQSFETVTWMFGRTVLAGDGFHWQTCEPRESWTKKPPTQRRLFSNVVPKAGVEPARLAPSVFETDVSTNSTTSAWFDDYSEQDLFVKGLCAGKRVCRCLANVLPVGSSCRQFR